MYPLSFFVYAPAFSIKEFEFKFDDDMDVVNDDIDDDDDDVWF